MAINYQTIKQSGKFEIEIKKSRFIGHVSRVHSEQEALTFLEEIQTKNRKATHNCYAYMIGEHDEIQRQSDNGEPSGTAGVPILEVLKNLDLHNIIVVVTRYFGGIKLGTGGLIRAYSGCTSQTIKSIGIVELRLQTNLTLVISYNLLGKLQNYLENNKITTTDTTYTDMVSVSIAVNREDVEHVKNSIINLLNGQVEIIVGENSYIEIPVKY